jgi:hypothetical protein
MKNAVFLAVAPCRACELNQRFGGRYRLHLRGRKIRERGTSVSRWQPRAQAGSSLADFSTLKMEAKRFSETSVQFTRSTRRDIPEDGILHNFKIIQILLSFMRTPNSMRLM